MKVAVRYFSRSGNTKKVAKAIAEALNVEADTVYQPLKEGVDILFLGNAPYGFDVHDEVKKFIKDIKVPIKKIVNFGTSAGIPSTRKYIGKYVYAKNIAMDPREFFCRGKFGIFHTKHPDAEDLKKAKAFALKIIDSKE